MAFAPRNDADLCRICSKPPHCLSETGDLVEEKSPRTYLTDSGLKRANDSLQNLREKLRQAVDADDCGQLSYLELENDLVAWQKAVQRFSTRTARWCEKARKELEEAEARKQADLARSKAEETTEV
ncbi:unnamed protein product [Cladocopium goreaui]|uniref:Uncharacterized protein n=1 Tax=Cladocopium goreaui TaxID=2562237 RepID=A0A9P1C8M5_9DINO|nr:unnamed protein product [Cladocopium goreaui]